MSTSVFAETRAKNLSLYDCTIEFDNMLIGGTPKGVKMIEGWLRSKLGITDPMELRRRVMQTLVEQGAEIEVPEGDVADDLYEASIRVADQAAHEKTTGFKKNGSGLYVEGRQVKAMLKEATNIAYAGKEKWGKGKGPKNFLAERVFVVPDEILLGRDEPDGTHMQIGHITGPQGPRSTLGYHEYVERASCEFQVEVLDDAIKDNQWALIWVVAERNGLGALRSQGFGTFVVTRWERVR